MRFFLFGSVYFLLVTMEPAWGQMEPVEIVGNYLKSDLNPAAGMVLDGLTLVATGHDLAARDGLLQEGFGVPSYYVPNRRLNPKLELLKQYADRPVMLYAYDCDGPNIAGLHVRRTMEPLVDEASIRVTWSIEHRGSDRQWVAPWVRHDVAPGGSVSAGDRIDVPSLSGLVQARRPMYMPAARNWIAATDPAALETVYAVYDADQTYAFLPIYEPEDQICGIQTAFVPFMMSPGNKWETTYRLNVARGLKRVDFATDELALQLDYQPGKLVALISGVRQMSGVRIEARVTAANGRVWKLAPKQFTIDPNKLARCSYDWDAPADGKYDFLAQLQRYGRPLELGVDTSSPHGGIDAQFVVGNPEDQSLEAWTDAPYRLDHGARHYTRSLARISPLQVWFETSLWKVFPEDEVSGTGTMSPVGQIALARGEHESFQIVLRPRQGETLGRVHVAAQGLKHESSDAVLPAERIALYNVAFQDVRVPSHFEGVTGNWPDMLPRFESFTAQGGRNYPLWFTVYAPPDQAPGRYRGMIEITADGLDPVELWLEAEVFDFELPEVPALRTDFVLDTAALPTGSTTLARYRENAKAHRVTLRELAAMPEPSGNYASALKTYQERLPALREAGVTTIALPPALADTPETLRQAVGFLANERLLRLGFAPLADVPPPPVYAQVVEQVTAWNAAAPEIPAMVTTMGLSPLLPDSIGLWAVHSQVFDTENNKRLLNAISEGREVWWFVNHTPSRPYANFFVDFSAVEHRILFWQTWALGVRGMHYWSVNYSPPGDDPWKTVLDHTPVNGDGLLLYPGTDGPVNSIRWEIIRDGIEDYDYLALFMEGRDRLLAAGGHAALLAEAAEVYDLGALVPDLIAFPRDPNVLLEKRIAIGRMIEAMQQAN